MTDNAADRPERIYSKSFDACCGLDVGLPELQWTEGLSLLIYCAFVVFASLNNGRRVF